MHFPAGTKVFVPTKRYVQYNVDVPAAAQQRYGAHPTYLPATATKQSGHFKLDWGGATLESDVAYPRSEEEEVADYDHEEVSDVPCANPAAVLHLLRKRFNQGEHGSRLGRSCFLWCNPVRAKAGQENSAGLMADVSAMTARYGSYLTTALQAAAAADGDTAAADSLRHALAPLYVKGSEVFAEMQREAASQTICIRGDYGSGKSAAYRCLLQHIFYESSQSQSSSTPPPLNRAASSDASFDPSSSSDCMRMHALHEEPHDYYFQPSYLSRCVEAGLRVQAAFGSVAAGSSQEFPNSSHCLSTARLVYTGTRKLEKVIFGLKFLDSARFKPLKRPNLPVNTEVTRMPYLVLLQFMASLRESPAAMEEYRLKPAEFNAYMGDEVICSAAKGVLDWSGKHVEGSCDAEAQRRGWAADFTKLKQALYALGMSDVEWGDVCKTLAVVVHLQCVGIVGVDSAIISAGSKNYLAAAEALLGVDAGALIQLLTKKVEKNKFTVMDNRALEARAVCETLTCEIYKRLAAYLTSYCSAGGSKRLRSTGSIAINLLDMASTHGVFDGIGMGNNLETINNQTVVYRTFGDFQAAYLHECVAAVNIDATFTAEVNKYQSEGVVLAVDPSIIPAAENGATVFTDMFVSTQPRGFISILQEACTAARPDDRLMSDEIAKMRFARPGADNGKPEESLTSTSRSKPGSKGFRPNAFVVKHSYGAVHYDGENFVSLNKNRALFGTSVKSVGAELLESGTLGTQKIANNANFDNTLDALRSADDSNGSTSPIVEPPTTEKVGPAGARASATNYGSSGFKAFGGKTVNPKTFAMRMETDSSKELLSTFFSTWDGQKGSGTGDGEGTGGGDDGDRPHKPPTAHFVLCIRPASPLFLTGLPPQLPVMIDSGGVDSQLRALHVHQVAQLLKIKFAEPSRTFHAFYERFKMVLPLQLHCKESQDSMRAVARQSSAGGMDAAVEGAMSQAPPFECSSAEAVRMVHSLCSLHNTREEDSARHISLAELDTASKAGGSILFLNNPLHNALEKFRTATLYSYNRASLLVQKRHRMSRARAHYRTVRTCIVRCQSHHRRRLAIREFNQAMSKCEYVKFKLLMLVARNRYRRMKAAVKVIKRWVGHKLQTIRKMHLLDKVMFLHSLARAALMKQCTMAVLSAVSRLQGCARLFLFRCRFAHKLSRSAVEVQRTYRAWFARKINIAIVTHIRKGTLRRKKAAMARRLQARHRAGRVRTRLRSVLEATHRIQHWSKGRRGRSEFLAVRFLAVWLQKQMRYRIANNRINRMLERKMMQDGARQIALAREREYAYTADYDSNGLCLGSLPHSNGHSVTALDLFHVDVFSDISLAYPEGWVRVTMEAVDSLRLEHRKCITKVAVGSHHTVLLDDRSNVYTFGLGDGGQLGHGNRHGLQRPKCIDKLQTIMAGAERGEARKAKPCASGVSQLIRHSIGPSTISVRDVACGREHTLLLTGGGRVWSWGSNKFGQLGHSNFESVAQPRNVVPNSSASADTGSMHSTGSQSFKQIKQISAGGYHSAALTESGTIYTWGHRSALGRMQGQSGSTQNDLHGYNTRSAYQTAKRAATTGAGRSNNRKLLPKHDSEPGSVPFFSCNVRIPIAQVVCGDSHVTVRCASTVRNLRTGVELYAWGGNSYGQLGVDSMHKEVLDPTRVELPATETVFVGLGGSDANTTTACRQNAGSGSAPAHGVSAKEKRKAAKEELERDKDGMHTRLLYTENDMSNASLVSGGRHMLLSLKGDVWAWGWNQYGQLGDGGEPLTPEDGHKSKAGEDGEGKPAPNANALPSFTVGGVVINADGTEGQRRTDLPECVDARRPKRVWKHGTFAADGSMRQYVRTVSAGWRYSAGCTYASKSLAAQGPAASGGSPRKSAQADIAAASPHSHNSGIFMWGAVPSKVSLLRNDSARLRVPAQEEGGNEEQQHGEVDVEEAAGSSAAGAAQPKADTRDTPALVAPGAESSLHIQRSKAFMADWGREMDCDTYESDDNSVGVGMGGGLGGDAEGGGSSPVNRRASAAKARHTFEEDPVLRPTAVFFDDEVAPASSLMSCGSDTFGVCIVISNSQHIVSPHVKRSTSSSANSPPPTKAGALGLANLPRHSTSPMRESKAVSALEGLFSPSAQLASSLPAHIAGVGPHSPKKRPLVPFAPWHQPAPTLKAISFGGFQESITEETRALRYNHNPKGLRAADLAKHALGGGGGCGDKDKGVDAALTETESARSAYTGMTGGSTSTSRALALSKQRAELKATLAATRLSQLRERETALGSTGVLGLLDPHVALVVEKDLARHAPPSANAGRGAAGSYSDSADGKKLKKRVSISFAPTPGVDDAFAAESAADDFREAPIAEEGEEEGDDAGDDDATAASASLQYEVAKMSNAYVNSEISSANANKRGSMLLPSAAAHSADGMRQALGEADSPGGVLDRRKSYVAKALLLGQAAEDAPLDLAATEKAPPGSLARYSGAAFDYGKRLSPSKRSSSGSPSPLRLSAVRDLAGMIEKIRVSGDQNN